MEIVTERVRDEMTSAPQRKRSRKTERDRERERGTENEKKRREAQRERQLYLVGCIQLYSEKG